MIYLYNYAGAPWKTQYWVRETIDRMYLPTPDGYCGDEDNGQTSAWYGFSALGFYPVTPATDEYVMGAPLFKEMSIQLPNGKTIEIQAPDNGKENRYIQSVTLNGKAYGRNYLKNSKARERGVGKGCVSTCRSRGAPCRKKKKQKKNMNICNKK